MQHPRIQVPTYECSLLQFWIDRMINTATQARIKHFGKSPKIRLKHFISCSYTDLVHLAHHLRKITSDTYTEEFANKTEGYGDCCMLTVLEWGHARNHFSDDVEYYDDEAHMDSEGEFAFQVNETCLHGNSKSFLITAEDRDSHNPMLVHLSPQEMTWNERRQYMSGETRQLRHQTRRERQKANKRKSNPQQDEQGGDFWNTFWSPSTSSSAHPQWRPRHR